MPSVQRGRRLLARREKDLAAARGIGSGVVLGVLLWCALAVLWLVLQ
jgi:hypothetical protein